MILSAGNQKTNTRAELLIIQANWMLGSRPAVGRRATHGAALPRHADAWAQGARYCDAPLPIVVVPAARSTA